MLGVGGQKIKRRPLSLSFAFSIGTGVSADEELEQVQLMVLGGADPELMTGST